MEFRYTLVSDGSSDRALLPILTWLIKQHKPGIAIQQDWADLGRLPSPPRTLSNKMVLAQQLWPSDLLFVHRDAEGMSEEDRLIEVRDALGEAERHVALPPVVTVVPVRMHEAWLLFNEDAIRCAAGNPNGRVTLNLPAMRRIEDLANPKEMLHQMLSIASGLTGRRLKRFNSPACAWAVSKYVHDFSQLRQLSAFENLERRLLGQL